MKIKKSDIFWTSVMLLVLAGLALISIKVFCGVLGVLCLISIEKEGLWTYFMPLTWVFFLFSYIFMGIFWISDQIKTLVISINKSINNMRYKKPINQFMITWFRRLFGIIIIFPVLILDFILFVVTMGQWDLFESSRSLLSS